VLTRVLIARDHPAEALKLLERLSRAAAAQDCTGSRIEIGALQGAGAGGQR
jgi:hypothetical protein